MGVKKKPKESFHKEWMCPNCMCETIDGKFHHQHDQICYNIYEKHCVYCGAEFIKNPEYVKK